MEFFDVIIRGFEKKPPVKELYVTQLKAEDGDEAIQEAVKDFEEITKLQSQPSDPTIDNITAYRIEGKTEADADDIEMS